VASIHKIRPDILPDFTETGEPIANEPPAGFFDEVVYTIDDIGQPINAQFFTRSNADPTNWYVVHILYFLFLMIIPA